MNDDQLVNDPKVQGLVECLIFAVNSFKDEPIFDRSTNEMTSWHTWFKKKIEDAGFQLKEQQK